jgi:hypothetical protein
MLLRHRAPLALFFAVAALLAPHLARADSFYGSGDSSIEERFLDGDLDIEDIIEGARVGRSHGGSQVVRTGTWVTVGGFFRTIDDKGDIGMMVLVGIAFDKVAQGDTHRLRDPSLRSALAAMPFADGPAPSRPAPADTQPPAPAPLSVTPKVARRAVVAAWKTSGIGLDDSRIDAMISRARASAALPETRLRVMKVLEDSSQLGVIPTDASTYDLAGANLYLEARLTWRLDRLLYADDEPTLERTRLERQDARERIAAKVVDALFQWQHARIAERGAIPASKEAIDASLRVAESAAALDILTGGWFSGWVKTETPDTNER